MRVALDYTPAISQIAGVGRYTRSLVAAMFADDGGQVDWTLFHTRVEEPVSSIPSGDRVSTAELPLSPRWANLLWHRLGVPLPLERFVGPASVIHGTDFVVPSSRAPSVVTVHDISYAIMPEVAFPKLRSYLQRAVPRSINRASRVIAVSETTKADLCEFYEISPNRVTVIHHAADPMFAPQNDTDLTRSLVQFGLRKPYFIIVGTIEPRKNHLALLRAFEQVHSRHPEASLVIVGKKGWLADGIIEAINRSAQKLPVFHLQGIRDEFLPPLYAGSVAMVYPSRYEGFGIPVLEAMASGTVAIVSDTPALREVGADAVLYAPVDDHEALAQQMIRVLESSDDRSRLVRAGEERSRAFSWSAAARAHLDVYRDVINE